MEIQELRRYASAKAALDAAKKDGDAPAWVQALVMPIQLEAMRRVLARKKARQDARQAEPEPEPQESDAVRALMPRSGGFGSARRDTL